MNDQTPRRYRGTLLERAAEHYHFGIPAAPKPAQAEPVAYDPGYAPDPMPVFEDPVPVARAPEPVAEPTPVVPEADPLPELELPIERRVDAVRRYAPIDRRALAEMGAIVPGGAVTPLAEEFRLVKRQLILTARTVAGADVRNDKARMILVCSAQPNEGKTFCAINLALSMAAEKDMQILLVDADFAKPDVLERLGLPQGPGLLDALSGAVSDVEDCILDTDIPQLSVLPAGTRNSTDTELLASDRARAIVEGLAAANPRRIVIFDSPPALAASPAGVLAGLVGQVMLVVRADRTNESDLREAVAMLDGCEHIQLVLNAVSFQPGGRRFGSYYGEAAK